MNSASSASSIEQYLYWLLEVLQTVYFRKEAIFEVEKARKILIDKAAKLTQNGIPYEYAEKMAVWEFEPLKEWPRAILPSSKVPAILKFALIPIIVFVRIFIVKPSAFIEKLIARNSSLSSADENDNPPSKIDLFLYGLYFKLCRELPKRAAFEAVFEAKSHLNEHAEELTENGIPIQHAQRMAVESFDDPKEWRKGIVEAYYKQKRFRGAKIIALLGFGICLGCYGFYWLHFGSTTIYYNDSQIGLVWLSIMAVSFISLLTCAVFSILARKGAVPEFLALLIVGSIATGVIVGNRCSYDKKYGDLGWFDNLEGIQSKSHLQKSLQLNSIYSSYVRNTELPKLYEGLHAYRTARGADDIPPSLKQKGRFILPEGIHTVVYSNSGYYDVRNLDDMYFRMTGTIAPESGNFSECLSRAAYKTTGDFASAKSEWLRDAKNRMRNQQNELLTLQIEASSKKAQIGPKFSWDAAYYSAASELLSFSVLIAILNLLTGMAKISGRSGDIFKQTVS